MKFTKWFVLVVFISITSSCEGENYESYKNAYEELGKDDVTASASIFDVNENNYYLSCISVNCAEYKFEKPGTFYGTYFDKEAKKDCYATCKGMAKNQAMDVTETTINTMKVQKENQNKTNEMLSEITELGNQQQKDIEKVSEQHEQNVRETRNALKRVSRDIESGLNRARESNKHYTDTETNKLRNDMNLNNVKSEYDNSLKLNEVENSFERYKLEAAFSIEKIRYEAKTDIKILETKVFQDYENLKIKFEEIKRTLDETKNSITKLEKNFEKLLLLNRNTDEFSSFRTKREENDSQSYIQFFLIIILTILVGVVIAVLLQCFFNRERPVAQANNQSRNQVQQIPPVGDTTSIDSFDSL